MGITEKLPFNWETVKKYSRRAGKEGMALAEATYLTIMDPVVSWQQRSALVAALVYFLAPLDGLPDFLPGGYVDDFSLLLGALLGMGSVGRKHLAACRTKNGLKPEPDDIEFPLEENETGNTETMGNPTKEK